MQRSTQRHGSINLLALLAVGGAGFAVARISHSLAGQVSTVFFGLGVLVTAISWFQMRLEERERLEKMEFDELARSKGGAASLFETGSAEQYPARRAREQFERFFVPIFTALIFLGQAGGAFVLWRWLSRPTTFIPLTQPAVALALFGLFALVLFLLGKFSATIARLEDHRLLRPGASLVLLGAYLSVTVALGIVGVYFEFPRADLYVAQGLCAVLGFMAVETLLTLVLELYRPRVKGKVGRPLYESRLVGLLAHPEGLFATAAHALDYQFGFKVSETWAYQMLAEKLPAFIAGLGAIVLLSDTVFFLDPGEQGVVERFGRSARAALGPGPHFKLPWPVDSAYRFDTGGIHTFNIGYVPDPAGDTQTTIIWTTAHYMEEYNLLVASRDQQNVGGTNQTGAVRDVPVNLLAVGIPIHFRITNVLEWAYGHAAPQDLLEQAASREVVRFFAGVDFLDIMSSDRAGAARELRSRIQSRADELRVGTEIVFVGLQDIHPPVAVADAFEQVNAAAQEVEAVVLRAQGETNKTVLLAQAVAIEKVRAAEGEAQRRVTAAIAQAARFTNQVVAFQAAPVVYPARLRLQTFARAAAGTRKYVVAPTNTHDVIQLNLEDRFRQDLYEDLTVLPPGAATRTNRPPGGAAR